MKEKIHVSNAHYKEVVDGHIRVKVFEEGDMFMVHLRKERFPKGIYNKLKLKKIRPCNILKKIHDNAYKVELPNEFDISPIFNIFYLF